MSLLSFSCEYSCHLAFDKIGERMIKSVGDKIRGMVIKLWNLLIVCGI